MTTCFNCGNDLKLEKGSKVSYSETCDKCDADVKACKNCLHYNQKAYNECNENQAERVVDKSRRNYCDYFKLEGGQSSNKQESKDDIFAKMDALFKKTD